MMKNICKLLSKNIFFLVGFIFLLLVGFLIFCRNFENETNNKILSYSLLAATLVGFLITYNQLRISLDKIKNSRKDFLDLEISVQSINDYVEIKTQVFNKSGENKEIDFAFLIISEQDSNFLKTINTLTNNQFDLTYTNDLVNIKEYVDKNGIYSNDIEIIPLSFYYNENVRIGNESPAYTHIFNPDRFTKNKLYSVRFFIFPENNNHYHRSSCGAFKL